MKKTRRSFTDGRETVKLVKQPGAKVTHIARNLGIEQSGVGWTRSAVRSWTCGPAGPI